MSSPTAPSIGTSSLEEQNRSPTSQSRLAGPSQPIDKPKPRTRLPDAPLKPRPVIQEEKVIRKTTSKPRTSKNKSTPKLPTATGNPPKSQKRKRKDSIPQVPPDSTTSDNNPESTKTSAPPSATSPRRRNSERIRKQSASPTPTSPNLETNNKKVPTSSLPRPISPLLRDSFQEPKPKRKRGPKTTGEIEDWLKTDIPRDIYSVFPRRPSYPKGWLDGHPQISPKSSSPKRRKRRTPEQLQEAQRIKEEKAAAKKEAKRIKAEAAAPAEEKRRIEKERLAKMQAEAEAWKKRDADAEWRRKEWVRMSVARDEQEKNAAGSWRQKAQEFLDDETGKVAFPIPRKESGREECKKSGCVRGERMGVCCHDVERVLREGAGMGYDEGYLRKERLRWHPDRFTGRGDVQIMAQEMFQMVQRLVDGSGRVVGP